MKENKEADTNMKFTKSVSVRGGLGASFVFESEADVQEWLKTDFPVLEQEYGQLTTRQSDLPGLSVGDTCYVYGEGSDKFRITGIVKYSPHRYGFKLDSGFSEEVDKCYV